MHHLLVERIRTLPDVLIRKLARASLSQLEFDLHVRTNLSVLCSRMFSERFTSTLELSRIRSLVQGAVSVFHYLSRPNFLSRSSASRENCFDTFCPSLLDKLPGNLCLVALACASHDKFAVFDD